MKLNIPIIRNTFLVLILLAFAACGDMDKINAGMGVDDEELSRDDYATRTAMTSAQAMVIPVQEHWYQFQESLLGNTYGGYLAPANSKWPAMFSTYNPPADWNEAPFSRSLTGFMPNHALIHTLSQNKVHHAIIDFLRIMIMHKLTDSYGPIPYTALPNSISLTNPYDSQEKVYTTMLQELDNIIEVLTDNKMADPRLYARIDNVYNGNLEKWCKLANSYKLRMAMRLTEIKPDIAKRLAEEAVNHQIGVITSNDEIAKYPVAIKNPLYLIAIEWKDDRVSADIVSYMNGYNDPRREKYFSVSEYSGYQGLRSGIIVPNTQKAQAFSGPLLEERAPLVWINAAEVAFLKAEGAARGWSTGGSAQALYEEGISLSFSQYGVSGVSVYIQNSTDRPAQYIDPNREFSYTGTTSDITIKWDEAASFEQKLERIITQKWIANFLLGHEAWAEFRRTGYPKLMPVVHNLSGGTVETSKMARRITYPRVEYDENRAYLNEAIATMLNGPDYGKTNLWWDVKK